MLSGECGNEPRDSLKGDQWDGFEGAFPHSPQPRDSLKESQQLDVIPTHSPPITPASSQVDETAPGSVQKKAKEADLMKKATGGLWVLRT